MSLFSKSVDGRNCKTIFNHTANIRMMTCQSHVPFGTVSKEHDALDNFSWNSPRISQEQSCAKLLAFCSFCYRKLRSAKQVRCRNFLSCTNKTAKLWEKLWCEQRASKTLEMHLSVTPPKRVIIMVWYHPKNDGEISIACPSHISNQSSTLHYV